MPSEASAQHKEGELAILFERVEGERVPGKKGRKEKGRKIVQSHVAIRKDAERL